MRAPAALLSLWAEEQSGGVLVWRNAGIFFVGYIENLLANSLQRGAVNTTHFLQIPLTPAAE